MKKQLENRWKNINEKLQAQEGLESDDAAALRKYVSTLRSAGEDGGKGPFWFPHIADWEMNSCTKVVFVFISRQLVDRFNCLSCDRPIVKYTHTQ